MSFHLSSHSSCSPRLDITTDLSTETFIRCLNRFATRRGLPHKVLSDNGKTFKSAAKFIKKLFKDEVVLNYLSGRGVEWMFNIEKAPWWGGIFERMVKSTKRCLKKMMGQAIFSLDEHGYCRDRVNHQLQAIVLAMFLQATWTNH